MEKRDDVAEYGHPIRFARGAAVRIEQLEFWDKDTGWKLTPATFFPDLTLLVGISGVGKTKILKAIRTLRLLTRRGDASTDWGISWRVQFMTSGSQYTWEGEFEERPEEYEGTGTGTIASISQMDDDDDSSARPKIQREQLTSGDEIIIDRDSEGLHFLNNKMPKLSPYQSALSLLREEDRIKPVVYGFGHIAYLDHTAPQGHDLYPKLDSLCRRYRTLKDIQEADLSTYLKLAVLHENEARRFEEIAKRFKAFFPLVEAIKFDRVSFGPFADVPNLLIKEVGIEKWIPERQISSGMYRTLMHLGSVALWPDESVILIDEFENSLGVNCLDDVTGDMMGHRHHLQFIVTSHHPYIINNVPPSHWKLVARNAGEVRTVSAAEAGIGRSRHESFIQLMNNPLYQDGVLAQ